MKDFDVTLFFRKAVNILFIQNPVGTGLGVLIGVMLEAVLNIMISFFNILSIGVVKLYHLIAVGVFGMNIKSYNSRHDIDPSITSAIEYIEIGVKEGRIDQVRAKLMYNDLYKKVLANVNVKPSSFSSESDEPNPEKGDGA
ncbi:hypothetical protein L3V43_05055 [Pseudoalteromonas sp. L23]|uniref:hypothetical protein n=1 Tax=unclassified Pseudoalteromonas TaxID=194690 RepID=UPI001EF109AB|nr:MULTISPECIES: hypothetical protein [unclassified Pseudoalteromonas]MCF7512972.1 hypothetical protein [Pseudoalteromonas sp. L7]MCF7525012.1 hypothetical protein [Pseudoalteromonas sp. L23]